MSVQTFEMTSAPQARSGEADLANLLGALRRRWRILAGAVGAALVLAVLATAVQKPEYTATALVMVDWRKDDMTSSQPVRESGTVNPEILDSEIELIRSRGLLARLVVAADKAGMNGPRTEGFSLKKLLGLKRAALSPTEELERDVDALEEKIKVKRRRLSYMIEIKAVDADPQKAAWIANTLSELYLDSQFETRVDDAGRASKWLNERLETLKADLAKKEQAVEDYRSANGLIASSGAMLADQQASGLQGELVTARADLAEKTARYRQVHQVMGRGGSVDTVAAVVNDASLSNLRRQEGELSRKLAELEERFREEHPQVKQTKAELANIRAQIDSETRRIVTSVRNDMEAAAARVGALASYASGVRSEITSNNRSSVHLRELEREAAATRAVYEGFLQRAGEVSQQETLKTSDVRLVAKAPTPRQPSAPIPARNILLGLLLGLAAGVGITVFMELLDSTLTGDADDVERTLNYSLITAIPFVKRREVAGLPPFEANPAGFLAAEPMSAYAEAVQALRASVDLSAFAGRSVGGDWRSEAGRAPLALEGKRERKAQRAASTSLIPVDADRGGPRGKVVAITSALSGDGKTTTAVALARAYALAGRRVVLIEGDLRNQAMVEHLKERPPTGLVHVLTGSVQWRSVLATDHLTSACFLPARAPTLVSEANCFALEDIFASRVMTGLLDDIRQEFDVVILDCPPILVANETRALARLADVCVVIARWGKTPKSAAASALKRLAASGANVIGVALNGVEFNSAGYYYSGLSSYLRPRSSAKAGEAEEFGQPVAAQWDSLVAIIPEREARSR
jgi:succinoglycan biosynthesis transport protein ExoP